MSDIKELIEAQVDSICRFGFVRFHLTYRAAVRAMLVEAIDLHGNEPAADVARAIGATLKQLCHEADDSDARRLEVVRYASQQLLVACQSLRQVT